MEGFLFGRSKEEQERRERVKAAALYHCAEERAKLQKCFRTNWFGICSKEHQVFWDCFIKERERQLLLEQRNTLTQVPDHHWRDTEDDKIDVEQ